MDMTTVLKAVPTILAITGYVSAFVSLFLFVKYTGTINALKASVETYQGLAEAYSEKIDFLTAQSVEMQREIEELKKEKEIDKRAVSLAAEETIKAFKRHGFCINAGTCKNFVADRREF